ncbi:hypothetical protein KDA_53060 [Dictyobacter alpinus]|uniref:Uncharacterized protein n=1 Tax=Dictyobacter alpinus TaxID=2014873 RepID=A0A402BEV1_9CHLR|nr:hypothetical protein [Dictyobacter alpinus]GCE29822.1 hypothetical protein KDA_53060 [Dictyobacter alpinus]
MNKSVDTLPLTATPASHVRYRVAKQLAVLILAEIITHALILRSEGHLSRWQRQLLQYPPALAHRLVADATELWKFPHLLTGWGALLDRHEPWRLAEILVRELH